MRCAPPSSHVFNFSIFAFKLMPVYFFKYYNIYQFKIHRNLTDVIQIRVVLLLKCLLTNNINVEDSKPYLSLFF